MRHLKILNSIMIILICVYLYGEKEDYVHFKKFCVDNVEYFYNEDAITIHSDLNGLPYQCNEEDKNEVIPNIEAFN